MPRVVVVFIQEYYELAEVHELAVELPGETATIREVLEEIPAQVRERLLALDGNIKYPAMVALNGRRIDFLEGLETRVKSGDRVLVSPRALFVV